MTTDRVQWADGHGWVVDRDTALRLASEALEIRRLCDPRPELRCTDLAEPPEENDQ